MFGSSLLARAKAKSESQRQSLIRFIASARHLRLDADQGCRDAEHARDPAAGLPLDR